MSTETPWFTLAHISSGSMALIAGTTAALLPKGDVRHRLVGELYVLAMTGLSLSALILSLQAGNQFLFTIAIFSFCMTGSAYLVIQRNGGQFRRLVQISAILSLGSGLALLVQTFWNFQSDNFQFNIIPLVFGLICLQLGKEDWKYAGKNLPNKQKIRFHIARMGGSLISAWTAFIVVNIPWGPPWLGWLLPTAIGSILISFAIKKYTAAPPSAHE